jgi:hypothetical protein
LRRSAIATATVCVPAAPPHHGAMRRRAQLRCYSRGAGHACVRVQRTTQRRRTESSFISSSVKKRSAFGPASSRPAWWAMATERPALLGQRAVTLRADAADGANNCHFCARRPSPSVRVRNAFYKRGDEQRGLRCWCVLSIAVGCRTQPMMGAPFLEMLEGRSVPACCCHSYRKLQMCPLRETSFSSSYSSTMVVLQYFLQYPRRHQQTQKKPGPSLGWRPGGLLPTLVIAHPTSFQPACPLCCGGGCSTPRCLHVLPYW